MMRTITRLIGVDNIKLFPVIQDTEIAYKCDKGIDLSGARQISLTYEMEETKSLLEPNKIISIGFEMENARLTKKDIEIIEKQPLQLKAQVLDVGDEGGDLHFCLYKATAKISVIGETDDYTTCLISGNGECSVHKFQRKNVKQSLIMDIELHSEAKDLQATEDISNA